MYMYMYMITLVATKVWRFCPQAQLRSRISRSHLPASELMGESGDVGTVGRWSWIVLLSGVCGLQFWYLLPELF